MTPRDRPMVAARVLGVLVAGTDALTRLTRPTVDPAPVLPASRSPRVPGWRPLPRSMPLHFVWGRGPLRVISSVGMMELPDGGGEQGPTWLISVSSGGTRATDREARRALRDFGMAGAEEDNHTPGIARAFFLVVDPARRVDCECKTTETVIVEEDGYRWSNPTDGPCRGCEFESIAGPARRCPLHGGAP